MVMVFSRLKWTSIAESAKLFKSVVKKRDLKSTSHLQLWSATEIT